MRRVALAIIALSITGLDRVTKVVVDSMELAAPYQLVGSFVQIIRGENRGGLFGLLQGSAPVLAGLSVGVIGVLIIFHERERRERVTPLTLGVGLLIGGAVGNLVDRAAFGYVLDFIDIGVDSLRFWTFNVADAGISVGIMILLADTLWRSRRAVEA